MDKLELVESLKSQAGVQDNPDQEGLDLFAELVMLECIKAVDALDNMSTAGDAIVEHFGLR